MASDKSTIQVAVRVRPINKREITAGQSVGWSIKDNCITQLKCENDKKESKAPSSFAFDHVFGPETSTNVVYHNVIKNTVQRAMEGYHASVFAYGQTSCGKTHTIHGAKGRPGVIQMTIADMFKFIRKSPDREFLLRVSYMEIYNESVNDLLVPTSTNLGIFEHRRKGTVIRGLLEEIVTTPERILELLTTGEAHRKVGCTNYNDRSSRSHTVFRIVIESKERQPAGGQSPRGGSPRGKSPRGRVRPRKRPVRVSTLSLTDLAGSESLRLSGAKGQRRKEGSFINKSLLTLSMVIRSLSNKKKKKFAHIPYRNSKLTRILQPSLSGNAQVGIICCVTPASGAMEETINTLDFASRAKTIEQRAVVNEVLDDSALLLKYKREINELRAQLQELKTTKQTTQAPPSPAAGVPIKAAPSLPPPSGLGAQHSLLYNKGEDEGDGGREEDMMELQEMISRLNNVILSAHSLDSPSGSGSGFDDGVKMAEKSSGASTNIDGLSASTNGNGNGAIALPTISSPPVSRLRRRSGSREGSEMAECIAQALASPAADEAKKGQKRPPRSPVPTQPHLPPPSSSSSSSSSSSLGVKTPCQHHRRKTPSRTPRKEREAMNELERIRQRLATMYKKKKQTHRSGRNNDTARKMKFRNTRKLDLDLSTYDLRPDTSYDLSPDHLKAPRSDATPARRRRDDGAERRQLKLEEKLEQLEAQIDHQNLSKSVQAADSVFLQKQLGERDDIIAEMSQVLGAMESKHQRMEDAMRALRRENTRFQHETVRLQNILTSREQQIAELKGVDMEMECF